jgi:hypothetical protein
VKGAKGQDEHERKGEKEGQEAKPERGEAREGMTRGMLRGNWSEKGTRGEEERVRGQQ